MEKLSIKIRKLTNPTTNAQRYILSPEKEKELFLTNVMGRMNKNPMEQNALSKTDRDIVKANDIGPSVERLQKQERMNNQAYTKTK